MTASREPCLESVQLPSARAGSAGAPTPPWNVAAPIVPPPGADPTGHLVDGWEAHRPLDDGLLRRFVFAYASSFVAPVALLGGRTVQRDTHVVWDRARPAGLFNGAMLLQPLPYQGWPAVVAALEDDLVSSGSGEVVLMSPWPTPDLRDRGWRLAGHPPLLVRPDGAGVASPNRADVRLVEVGDRRTLADWERVAVEGYPFDDLRPAQAGSLVDERILADPQLHAWVAYEARTPVAIGTSYVTHASHVLTLGVTLPERRGRGLWHALTARRLTTFPSLPAMAVCSDHSRPLAEGLGFVPLSRWTVWLRDRPGPTAHRAP